MTETYTSAPAEYELSGTAETVRFRIRCACGNERRNVRAVKDGIDFLREALARSGVQVPPDLPIESFWCNKCKKAVKITARMLGLAA